LPTVGTVYKFWYNSNNIYYDNCGLREIQAELRCFERRPFVGYPSAVRREVMTSQEKVFARNIEVLVVFFRSSISRNPHLSCYRRHQHWHRPFEIIFIMPFLVSQITGRSCDFFFFYLFDIGDWFYFCSTWKDWNKVGYLWKVFI
jgi:hypothetical protein